MQNQYVNGFIADSKEFYHLLTSFPGSVYCKDKQGTYLAVNKFQLHMIGNVEMVGKKDKDFCWGEQAPTLQQNDHKIVYLEKPATFIEPCVTFDKKLRSFLSYKFPLKNKVDKVIGLFGMSVLLDDSETMNTWLIESSYLHLTNLLSLNKDLTLRQLDCLYYLVRGMTMKQIAQAMNLAPKTIEHYLESIKKKLNCQSRTELISHALQIPYIRKKL